MEDSQMAHERSDALPWPPGPQPRPTRADLAAPATQIVRDRESYLGQGSADIGRRISDEQVELFVAGDAALALRQQFERLAPDFIALHDVGTSASLRLLGALAGAAGARVQHLTIRRQGPGVPLAVVQFVEVPVAGDGHVRVYSTDLSADTATRQQMALVLLSRCQLGALLVGELPAHAIGAALRPLQDAIARSAWPNRELLMLPLGSSGALAAQASQLAGGSGVVVRVTPHAARPNDAWSYISGAWNRLVGHAGASAALDTDIARAVPRPPVPLPEAPTQPMELAPTPLPPPAAGGRWSDYAERCAALKGVVVACVFDVRSQRPLAYAGRGPAAAELALHGGVMLGSIAEAMRALGLARELPELAASAGDRHLLLRPVPGHAGIVAHLVVEGPANLVTLAQRQLGRLAPPDPI
jgi:hypothetical protein